jgi:hypothetical protein
MALNHPTNERLYDRAAVVLDELEQLPVGAGLLAGLVGLRALVLDSVAAVRATVLWDRLTAHCQAQAMVTTAEAVEGADLYVSGVRHPLHASDLIGDELAALTHVPGVTAKLRVALTGQVQRTLPASWEALDRGDIRLEHLRALANETKVTTPRVAQAVDAALIPAAIDRGWTPGRLATEARKAIITADPDGAAERADTAKRLADVHLHPAQDETAVLEATGDAILLRRVMDAIHTHAAELTRDAAGNDAMPVGLARFTALADLVLGDHAARKTEVLLNLDLTTWLGITANPGDLAGYGPISPDTARTLAADAGFRLMLTDPTTSQVIGLGHTRYQPTAALRRFIQARDQTCQFPSCQHRATGCDLDHITNYHPTSPTGGCTDPNNLHALCRYHHNLKTHQYWHVDQQPNGDELWTSPLGFTHLRKTSRHQFQLTPPPDQDEDDQIPEHIDNRIPNQRDPNTPTADDPLPDLPTPTLEDYQAHADNLERQLINNFLTDYFQCINEPAPEAAA